MKKTLLTALFTTPFLLFAQNQMKELPVPKAIDVKVSAQHLKAIDNEIPNGHTAGSAHFEQKTKKDKNYSSVLLGKTYYDLQTNSSPGRRIVLHEDGTISAVWTASPDAGTGYPNRGTGYNYFDGTTWLSDRDNNIETEGRTGWPSIMLLDDGRERILAHEAGTGGFIATTNSAKGSTDFSSVGPILDDETAVNVNRVPIWNRSVASNGKIHTIANYWVSEDANVPMVTLNGVNSPTTYSRWDVAGDTADIAHSILPGFDSTLYTSGAGDRYAIDSRDSIVAILMGGLGEPVSLWKSTDNGTTWAYTDVDSIRFKGPRKFAQLLLSGDTLNTNDGSLDVMIDANGDVHAFYGLGRILGGLDQSGDSSFFFFPAQTALMHWKEGDSEPKIAGTAFDQNGNGELDINAETFQFLDDNNNVPNNLLSAARTGSTSLVTMPSASVDAEGNLFVVYSAPVEEAVHFLNANFRDIFVSFSTDGGSTWNGPQNITKTGTAECNFPCVAKVTNDFLHLIWQEDATPGTHLQNHSASAGTHPNDVNYINYAAIPVSDILNNVVGTELTNVNEGNFGKDAEVFVVSQNQPNPFSSTSEVIIYLRDASQLTLTITDLLGNVVNTGGLGILTRGNHTVTVDATTLSAGMYFYTIASPKNSITRKMQVN